MNNTVIYNPALIISPAICGSIVEHLAAAEYFIDNSKPVGLRDLAQHRLIEAVTAGGRENGKALSILLDHKSDWAPATRRWFETAIRPNIEAVAVALDLETRKGDGVLMIYAGGKSYTFHTGEKVKKTAADRAKADAALAARRALRVANSPKGVIGQKPNNFSKKN